MTVAIVGGRFDPPHIGHYLIAQQILEHYPIIDKLLLVPAAQHQWKPTQANATDRHAMVKLLAGEKMEASDIEIKRGGISYTQDTLKEVQHLYKADKLYWIVGTDIVAEFGKWDHANQATALATFLVFPRDPYHLPKTIPHGFELIQSKDLITTNLSSTTIRERIKKGLSITHLVPEKIEKYIQKHKLYSYHPAADNGRPF